jgi:hypothetical protein
MRSGLKGWEMSSFLAQARFLSLQELRTGSVREIAGLRLKMWLVRVDKTRGRLPKQARLLGAKLASDVAVHQMERGTSQAQANLASLPCPLDERQAFDLLIDAPKRLPTFIFPCQPHHTSGSV